VTKKIQGGSGSSLAGQYDVKGGAVDLKSLHDNDVGLVQDMGSTMFSERMGSGIRRLREAGIAQSTQWRVELTDLPRTIFRVLGVQVFMPTGTAATEMDFATVYLQNSDQDREIPLWSWDGGTVLPIRMVDAGAAEAAFDLLVNQLSDTLPALAVGTGQKAAVGLMPNFVMRGFTPAFGAGTTSITALIQIASPDVAGVAVVRSRGLPIPSW